jgi:hypothetical protein
VGVAAEFRCAGHARLLLVAKRAHTPNPIILEARSP